MSPPSGRRRRPLGLLVGLGLVSLWLALATWSVVSAVGASRAGIEKLDVAQEQVAAEDSTDPRSTVDVELLEAAASDFRRAEDRLSQPWVLPVRIIPFVGRQVTALRDLARAGAQVTDVVTELAVAGQEILDKGWDDPPQRPALMRALADISSTALTDLDDVDPGPGEALIGPLQKRYDFFVTEYGRLERSLEIAAAVGDTVADVLQGPQTTLVLAANNSEMRNGSGMFLSAGEVVTNAGQISPVDMRPTSEMSFPADSVSLDPDVQAVWGWLDMTTDVRNQGATPRFDVTARQVADMWTAVTGTVVDNVVSVDVRAISLLFEATGGVEAGDQDLDASSVESYLLHDQYGQFQDPRSGARFEQLGDIAAAVLTSIAGGDFAPVPALAAVEEAVAGRHLMIWSRDPDQQAAWEAAGLSGTVGAQGLSLGVINRGANKLDWLLGVGAEIVIGEAHESADGGMRRDGELIVTLLNTAGEGEVRYVAGPNGSTGLEYGDYLGLVTLYTPELVSDVELLGGGRVTVSGKDGASNVNAVPARIPMGESRTVRFSFTLPDSGALEVLPSGRYPHIEWRYRDEVWQDWMPHRVEW